MSTEITQDTVEGWRDFFQDFEDIWVSVFKPKGISRDTALIVWHINLMKNRLDETMEHVAHGVDRLTDSLD